MVHLLWEKRETRSSWKKLHRNKKEFKGETEEVAEKVERSLHQ